MTLAMRDEYQGHHPNCDCSVNQLFSLPSQILLLSAHVYHLLSPHTSPANATFTPNAMDQSLFDPWL